MHFYKIVKYFCRRSLIVIVKNIFCGLCWTYWKYVIANANNKPHTFWLQSLLKYLHYKMKWLKSTCMIAYIRVEIWSVFDMIFTKRILQSKKNTNLKYPKWVTKNKTKGLAVIIIWQAIWSVAVTEDNTIYEWMEAKKIQPCNSS